MKNLLLSIYVFLICFTSFGLTTNLNTLIWTYQIENNSITIGSGKYDSAIQQIHTNKTFTKTIVITNKNVSFKNIVIPKKLEQLSITKIAKYAFVDCEFETCILPPTLEYIEYGAFLGCKNLTTISIPKNVKFIGAGAFGNCPNLKTLIFEGKIPKFGKLWDKETIFDYNP